MYNNWEKYLDEKKPRKHSKKPSFSSVLLDEVFRSIDGDNEVLNSSTRKNINNVKSRSFWDNDYMSYISTSRSSSSDLSFSSGFSFSSETENSSVSYKSSKQKTLLENTANASWKKSDATFFQGALARPRRIQDSFHDVRTQDYYYHNDDNTKAISKNTENSMIKSKSRAMKIYSNLKKIKQPISPGGRLSSFIHSLFTSENSKKMKNKNVGVNKNGFFDDGNFETNMKSTTSSCSSVSSFSRSCLSRNSKAKIEKVERRTVRFYPISTMILDDDSHHSRQKSNGGLRGCKNQIKLDEFVREMGNVHNYEEEVDDEDGFSDCSSDLFEIDHLGVIGSDRFCDELPVYGTTHVNRSRRIIP